MFITFEGPDGCGKTTLARGVYAVFREKGLPTITTREPGGTPLGEQLRSLLLNAEYPLSPQAQTLLHFAIRDQHLTCVIRPALQKGIHVLCDRFTTSTWAYQHAGMHVSADLIRALETAIVGPTRPDKIIIPMISLEESQRRLLSRDSAGDPSDRYESLGVDFLERMYRYFLTCQGDPYIIVDGMRPPEDLVQEVCHLLGV